MTVQMNPHMQTPLGVMKKSSGQALFCVLGYFLWAMPFTPLAQENTQAGGAVPELTHRYDKSSATPSIANIKLKLPYLPGATYQVFQANSGTFTHTGFNRYAWDFGLPEGTPVCAAAEGRVVRVKQDSAAGGTSTEDYGHANTIIIDHGAGLFTQYLHLKRASARVTEGELIPAGHIIGLSGNTGFSTVPHLHFQVQDATGQSLPARFLDVSGDGIPKQGLAYVSANDGTETSRFLGDSKLPLDAFERNEVLLTEADIPAHRLESDKVYRLRGRVKSSAKKVAVFMMSPRGGKALLSVFAPVTEDGTFTTDLHLSDLKKTLPVWSNEPTQSNAFSFALAPVQPDGSFWSTFSIPVTIR